MSPYSAPGIIKKVPLSIQLISHSVCDYFKVDYDSVFSKSRKSSILEIRQIVMYLSYKFLPKSYKDIGDWFGMDHTTIMNSCTRIQNRLDTEKMYVKIIEDIEDIIKEKTLGLN